MSVLAALLGVVVGFLGTGFYLWIRAEMDERAWRKAGRDLGKASGVDRG